MGKTLVLSEKPSVARDYAEVLGCSEKKDGYIEGEKYIVTWAFGHLFTLKEPGEYNENYKKWILEDLPIVPGKFEIKLNSSGAKQYKIIKNLIERKDVDLIINGGDAGREGELIQRYIIQETRTKKRVKRLWLSTLTKEDIIKGFNNLKENSEYDNLYKAAKTRAEIDWLLGMNYTRAYTKKKGENVLLSIGRCQTPILNLIVSRDIEIENFKSEPYWEVIADFENYKGKYIKNNDTKINKLEEAEKIKTETLSKGTGQVISVEKEEKKVQPPQLFNLTNLQKTMNKKFGFTAQKTLDVAQKLYEEYKILSYPRTSSRYLSQSFTTEFTERLECLEWGEYKNYIQKLDKNNLKISKRFIDDTKITDHHALVPTKNNNIEEIYNKKLSDDEKKLFNEVTERFISCFYIDYVYESTIVITEINEFKHQFKTIGKKEIQMGWREIYSDGDEEDKENNILPDIKQGENKKISDVEIESKKTKPAANYTEHSLLGKLEKYNIGTEATRANIIETLLKRDYIKRDKKNLVSTDLGRNLIKAIDTEMLKSVELTAELEDKLEKIVDGKIEDKEVLEESIRHLKTEIEKLKSSAGEVIKKQVKVIGKCPKCEGSIIEGKKGYGCSNWKEGCTFVIWKNKSEVNISAAQAKDLLEKGKTNIIKGFKNKEGKTFEAALILKDGKIEFDFSKYEDGLGMCPICKKGIIIKNKSGFGCSEWKNGCTFFVKNEIAGKKIGEAQVKKLITRGKTSLIKGFKSKKEEFDAALIIVNGEVKFEFPKTNK